MTTVERLSEKRIPERLPMSSRHMKPTLCLDLAWRSPGFPRPTMSFIGRQEKAV